MGHQDVFVHCLVFWCCAHLLLDSSWLPAIRNGMNMPSMRRQLSASHPIGSIIMLLEAPSSLFGKSGLFGGGLGTATQGRYYMKVETDRAGAGLAGRCRQPTATGTWGTRVFACHACGLVCRQDFCSIDRTCPPRKLGAGPATAAFVGRYRGFGINCDGSPTF